MTLRRARSRSRTRVHVLPHRPIRQRNVQLLSHGRPGPHLVQRHGPPLNTPGRVTTHVLSNCSTSGRSGLLERKQRQTKMDKMKRISKVLNPKHWRHSKAEPEPLPHPSAMGLMALAARPHESTANDYQHHHMESSSSRASSIKSGSVKSVSTTDPSSEEEECGNVYEDVEIGPIKSATMATPAQDRQAGAFSGPQHKSMPQRTPGSWFSRNTNMKDKGKPAGATPDPPTPETKEKKKGEKKVQEGGKEPHIYDVPTTFTKAKNWASNIGSNISSKFQHAKPQYDVPKNNKAKEDVADSEGLSNPEVSKNDKSQYDKPASEKVKDSTEYATSNKVGNLTKGDQVEGGATASDTASPRVSRIGLKPPRPPPPLILTKRLSEKVKETKEEDDSAPAPVLPVRRKGPMATTLSEDSKLSQETSSEKVGDHLSLSKSKSLNDSTISTSGPADVPTPKPRNVKKLSADGAENSPPPTPRQRSPKKAEPGKGVEPQSNDSKSSETLGKTPGADDAIKPKLPPKPGASRSIETAV